MENKFASKEFKEEPKKKNGVIKYTIYIILVVVITGLAIYLSLRGKFGTVFGLIKGANTNWILLALLVMFVSVLIRALILFVFARLYSRDYYYHQALAVESIGTFYSAVTPGSSGGQVMEAYTFQRQGLPVSNAVSMLAMYSILYQAVLTLFGLASFIVEYETLNAIKNVTLNFGAFSLTISIWVLTIIGFLLNVSVLVVVLLMSYWKAFHNFIMGPVINIAYKLHIVRNKEESRDNLRVQIVNFKIELRRLFTNGPFTVLVVILFTIMMFARFSLPYFCGEALGNESEYANLFDAVFLCNYHQMVTGLIPIPGSAGVSEYFFHVLFVNSTNPKAGFFYSSEYPEASEALGSAALLIWRTISFTLPLTIAGFVTAFYRTKGKHSARYTDREVYENRKTMIEMRRETMLERQTLLDDMIHTSNLNKEAIKKKMSAIHRKEERIKDPMRDNDETREINIGGDDD